MYTYGRRRHRRTKHSNSNSVPSKESVTETSLSSLIKEIEQVQISLYRDLLTRLIMIHNEVNVSLISSLILSKALTASGIRNLVIVGWLNFGIHACRHVWVHVMRDNQIIDMSDKKVLELLRPKYELVCTCDDIVDEDEEYIELEILLDKVCVTRCGVRIVVNTELALETVFENYSVWKCIHDSVMYPH